MGLGNSDAMPERADEPPLNPYAWLRWGVLLAGLVNLAVVVMFVASGLWYAVVGNVTAAGVCIGAFVWAQRGVQCRTTRRPTTRHGR